MDAYSKHMMLKFYNKSRNFCTWGVLIFLLICLTSFAASSFNSLKTVRNLHFTL